MKVLIFGTGVYYQRYKKYFTKVEIVAFLDNDKKKQRTLQDGVFVCSPQEGIEKEYDQIFILSIYAQKMKEQLLDLGVAREKIYIQDELYDGLGENIVHSPLKVYGKYLLKNIFQNKTKRRIVLVSHLLSYSGGCIALLYAADLLKKYGYNVFVIADEQGKLYKEYLSKEIPVIIDNNFIVEGMELTKWVKYADCIILNTVLLYPCLINCVLDKPIIWWLHEPKMLYAGISDNLMRRIKCNSLSIYAVSSLAREAFHTYCPNATVGNLLYGIPDFYKKYLQQTKSDNHFIFAVIGGICEVKGQDVLLDAIDLLPQYIKDTCEIWLIGQADSSFGKKIIMRSSVYQCVKYLGELTRDEIEKIYKKIAMLICPSREDSMPVVVTEAMMNHKPVIVSDATGIVQYIVPERNGLIFKAGDAIGLKDKMLWVINHKESLSTMGVEARLTYETNFSMEKFRSNLLRIVEENIAKNIRHKICEIPDDVRKKIRDDLFGALTEQQQGDLIWHDLCRNNNINGCLSMRSLESDELLESDLWKWMENYINCLKNNPVFAMNKELISDVQNIITSIKKAYRYYITGKEDRAVLLMNKVLNEFIDDEFIVAPLDSSYALRGLACFSDLYSYSNFDYSLMKEHDLTLFRARIDKQKELRSRIEMVHRPFICNEKIPQQRFTFDGIPALYLSTTSYACYLEIGAENKKDFFVSAFKPNDKGKKLKILNLAISEELINGMYDKDIDQTKNQERKKRLQESLIKIFPIVYATSYKIMTHEQNYKKEYVFPALIMKCLKSIEIDGIAYISKKIKPIEEMYFHLFVNVVLPIYDKSIDDKYGSICNDFVMTMPFNILAVKDKLKGMKSGSYVSDIYCSDKRFDVPTVLMDNRKCSYISTEFCKFDNYLSWEEFDKFLNSDINDKS